VAVLVSLLQTVQQNVTTYNSDVRIVIGDLFLVHRLRNTRCWYKFVEHWQEIKILTHAHHIVINLRLRLMNVVWHQCSVVIKPLEKESLTTY